MLFVMAHLYGGTTGKLAGLVTDKNTGEPLVGANVVLEGTTMGAATDVDGYYAILNVPAGVYTVVVSYIGYNTVKMENVRIVPDITTTLDFELEESTLKGEEIVVVAQKPFFEKNATNTVKVLEGEELEKLPIKGITKFVGLSAGVVMADGSGGETGNAVLNIRGGRGNETLVLIDGIPYNDALFGNAVGSIPDVGVEQVTSQLGGFSAKYGNAQSGIVNIITKSGRLDKYFGSFEGVSSKLTDPYGYNQFTFSLGGPLRMISKKLSFFSAVEYINTDDDRPSWAGVKIPTVGIDSDKRLNAGSELLRFNGKLTLDYSKIKFNLSFTGSNRERHGYIHSYAKNNSMHNPLQKEWVRGISFKMSHFVTDNFFYDAIIRYRSNEWQEGDGIFFDQPHLYADVPTFRERFGVELPAQGARLDTDPLGIFYEAHRVYGSYTQYLINTYGADLNFTYQWKKHSIEFGGSYDYRVVRYYSVYGPSVSRLYRTPGRTPEDWYYTAQPAFYGYTVTGAKYDGSTVYKTGFDGGLYEVPGPMKPVTAALYINDKIEFRNFVLNAGLRWDYFDPAGRRLADKNDIFKNGSPTKLDPEDFEDMPVESYISPRLGFAFPVTDKTTFYAQYGIFRQIPRLIDLYPNWFDLLALETDQNRTAYHGHLKMEETTQYEFGFNQQIGNVASVQINAFYKNIRGLVNIVREKTKRGNDEIVYLSTANTDFGTVKGISLGLEVRNIGVVSARADYTFSLAEGTGSSQSSNFIAAFRNTRGEIPKTIAPLDFDQRHTLTSTISVNFNKNEGPTLFGVKPLKNSSTNLILNYSSGRPYTPLEKFSLLPGRGSNQGNVTYYVNSAYGPGTFRIDLSFERSFNIGKGYSIVGYLWIQNLLNHENVVRVYRSTGEPDNTAWAETDEAQGFRYSSPDPDAWLLDYKAMERNPGNWGLPRIIRLGVRFKF